MKKLAFGIFASILSLNAVSSSFDLGDRPDYFYKIHHLECSDAKKKEASSDQAKQKLVVDVFKEVPACKGDFAVRFLREFESFTKEEKKAVQVVTTDIFDSFIKSCSIRPSDYPLVNLLGLYKPRIHHSND